MKAFADAIPYLLGVIVLIGAASFLWRTFGGRRRHRHRHREHGGSGTQDQGEGQRLGSLAREVRNAEAGIDRLANEATAFRAEIRTRMDSVESRLSEVERRSVARERSAPAPAALPAPRAWSEPAAAGWDLATGTGAGATYTPGPSARPVEVRDGVLVLSQLLPPAAYAEPAGYDRARVFLRDLVELNEFALPKWEAFFEMRGARPYAAYRTVRPAEVVWDAAAGRGTPLTPGVAEAV